MRDHSKATDLAERGPEVRVGDFANPDGLEAALTRADQVLIVSAGKLGDEARQLHRNAIQAAKSAGVRRILYTSQLGARAGSPFLSADQHAGTEADLAARGLTYTSLRTVSMPRAAYPWSGTACAMTSCPRPRMARSAGRRVPTWPKRTQPSWHPGASGTAPRLPSR